MNPPIICLMGPTASGKTPLAVQLVQQFPCDIVSVDSALVYRGMDIGTAKPTPDVQQLAPHRLIDRVDPSESYSAGRFREEALQAINEILAQGRVPLLVGGTMLYFRVLQQGLAALPKADKDMRATLSARALQEGWDALHAELATVDPDAAKRIQPRDSQRIQRALEVYYLTGQTITAWQAAYTSPLAGYQVHNLALIPSDRARLHQRIAERFHHMLALGLVEEVRRLHARGDLSADLPSIRSVGYRQVWAYLEGELSYADMQEKAITATRQLAKRQITWLRSWPDVTVIDSESKTVYEQAATYLRGIPELCP